MRLLSIIIVNYNGGTMIIDAIRSVYATKGDLSLQLIVVDNGSSDGSVDAIRKQFGKEIEIIEMKYNAGFAAANNAGLTKAKGSYIFFLNPDTIVLDGALQTMVQYLNEHPQVGACGANLYDRDMRPQFSYWMLFPGVRMEWSGLFSDAFLRLRHHYSHEHNYTDKPKQVAYIMGADLMIRREVIEQVGPMDENFFLFYEETELCYRIHKAGHEIVNIPQAQIIHLEGQTIDKMNVRREQMMRSRAIYLRKCCPPIERAAANTILAISSSIRFLWFAITGNKEKQQFWKYTLQHI